MRDPMRKRLERRIVIASISGGKDSAAMSLWLHEQGIEHERVFLDTGWEHPATYEYIRGPLAETIGPITWLRADKQMVELIRRKGTFPSRMRRWCTWELKVVPLRKYIRTQIDAGEDVVNVVGVRAEESTSRARLPEWEWSDALDCETWRPILRWTEEDVIAIHRRHGLRPNPLYLLGAHRVGCWPCIYARKGEIRLIADTDPGRIGEIAELERELSERAGEPRGWFQAPLGREGVWPIEEVVRWSRTSRGGRQYELFASTDSGCMRWGLCETEAPCAAS